MIGLKEHKRFGSTQFSDPANIYFKLIDYQTGSKWLGLFENHILFENNCCMIKKEI